MKPLKNNKGMILVMATAIIMALSILAISVLSIAGSQSFLGQRQVDRIKAEELAKGAYWVYYMNRATHGVVSRVSLQPTLDGKVFTARVTPSGLPSGPNNTFPVSSKVSY
jgi:hypothetical protein